MARRHSSAGLPKCEVPEPSGHIAVGYQQFLRTIDPEAVSICSPTRRSSSGGGTSEAQQYIPADRHAFPPPVKCVTV